MSESRLFQIIYYLLNKGEATAAELAEKFEVSIRTIYRDIDKLSGAGIPVYTTAGYGGGVHLDESFVLKKSLLSKEDMQNILMGMQSLSAVGFSRQNDCLDKLRGLFQIQDSDWIEVDFSRWGCDPERERNTFGLLKEAIQQKRRVRFAYYNAQGESSRRECLPMKLVFKDRAWYLRAYCLKRNAERLFRLSRIRELEMTGEYFETIPKEPPSELLETVRKNPPSELLETVQKEPPSELLETVRKEPPSELLETVRKEPPSEFVETIPKEPPSELVETVPKQPSSELLETLETVPLNTDIISENKLSESAEESSSETAPAKAGRTIEMELSFEKKDAYRVYDIFDESMIMTGEDRLIVKAAMPEDEWLYGFLMSFGDRLTVLSPAYLVDELMRRFQAAYEHMSQSSMRNA